MKANLMLAILMGIFVISGTISCKKLTVENTKQKLTPKGNFNMEQTATIETKHGNIVIKFFPDLAPEHVKSFLKLAKDGFYNKTTFHRVIPGFMIQGGDPNSKDADKRHTHGTGNPGYSLPAEFSDTPHKRGIVSAARSQDPNSAGSQFFICVNDSNFLDGQYTVFGEVIEGMDVADKIVAEPKDGNDNPTDRIEMTVTVNEAAE
ncbi:MAG: peptidylprolyl isomerase [Leptospirales bacterium]